MRVLLTGGSGFIASHVLDSLLHRGHSVVTTVRSPQKGQQILAAHPSHSKDTLDFTIVEDIAHDGAFDRAVVSTPAFEAVIHTASPYHFNSKNNKKELLEPAVNGTLGILKSIKAFAPTVKRVVITSSSAAVLDQSNPPKTYSEKDWCPITEEEALVGPANGYRASKTFAERAAWKFVDEEQPSFKLTVMNPPLVLGPVIHHLPSLSSLNTSNLRIRDILTGASQSSLPPTGNHLFIDVRDLALGHVLGIELPSAAGQRFFMVSGKFSNREIAEIIREHYPEFRERLPTTERGLMGGDYPGGDPAKTFGFDNSKAREVFGIEFRELEESIVDAVESLKAFL
ncbi:Fc.00g035150.m01.CDS01 [Cosmosporella sp. VM-42]